jgi:ABC-type uncharacterized transport system permease subunit
LEIIATILLNSIANFIFDVFIFFCHALKFGY